MTKLLKKLIFVVENNLAQAKDIREHFAGHPHFDFRFFNTSKECLEQLHQHPLAVFIDNGLREINTNEKDSLVIIDKIKELDHDTEVVLFSEHDNIAVSIEALKHGVYDYIVMNDVRYHRMENTLLNIEEHAFVQKENRKFKKIVTITAGVVIVWVIIVIILVAFGILKPGNNVLM